MSRSTPKPGMATVLVEDTSPATLDMLAGKPLPPGTSHIRLIEISTLSGSAALAGRSHGLGNNADSQLLHRLREESDVVVVGSHTVNAEKYVGIKPTTKRPHPAPIAVITSSLSIEPDSQLITQTTTAPMLLVPSSVLKDPDLHSKRMALEDAGVTMVDCGGGSATDIVTALNQRGYHRITCEGGPGVYGLFIAAGEVDQLYLTLAPGMSSSVEKTLVSEKIVNALGQSPQSYLEMELEQVALHPDSTVFLRYRNPARN